MKITTQPITFPAYIFLYFLFISYTPLNNEIREIIAAEIEKSSETQLLNKCYPLAIDKEDGGYLSNFSHDFQAEKEQEKMIVSQARHLDHLKGIFILS